MAVEYVIVPKRGKSFEDVLQHGINFDTVEIAKMVGGEEVERLPYTPSAERLLRPKLHENLMKSIYVYDRGRFIPIEIEFVEKDVFRGGCDPFKQALVMAVNEGFTTIDSAIDFVVKELKILRDTQANRNYLKELIKYMTRDGYLLIVGDSLKIGYMRLPLNNVKIQIERGYHPILKEIEYFLEKNGRRADFDTISHHLITVLRWIEHDPILNLSPHQKLWRYLNFMRRKGYVEFVGEKSFVLRKPVESY